MNPRSALITGRTGFAGSNLARRLMQDGWDVHVINKSDKHGVLQDLVDRFTFNIHDGSTERRHEIFSVLHSLSLK